MLQYLYSQYDIGLTINGLYNNTWAFIIGIIISDGQALILVMVFNNTWAFIIGIIISDGLYSNARTFIIIPLDTFLGTTYYPPKHTTPFGTVSELRKEKQRTFKSFGNRWILFTVTQ